MNIEYLYHGAYHVAEKLHLAYGFPLMLREVGHWMVHSARTKGLRLATSRLWGKIIS